MNLQFTPAHNSNSYDNFNNINLDLNISTKQGHCK